MNIKKVVAMALAAGLCFSVAGCVNNEKKLEEAKEEILELVEDHADGICDDFSPDNGDEVINEVVEDSLSFEIDEDSLEIDDDEASVDVVFTVVDLENIGFLQYFDVDAVASIINQAESKEFTVTYELELDDDEWIISNENDVTDDFDDNAYYDFDLTVYVVQEIEETEIVSSSEDVCGQYTGTTDITGILNEYTTEDAQFTGELSCSAMLTLNQDGTYSLEILDSDQLVEDYRDFMINNLPAFAAIFGGVTEDELLDMLTEYGYSSYEEFIDENFNAEEVLTANAFSGEGTYSVSGDRITLNSDNGSSYEGTISGNVITMSLDDSFETVFNRI